ncbi:MAG: F0F1 ATP synthase subunit I [Gammaproteobacteria bacterium]|nr:F0F1 ATP synthase subunit I [Gammaproteobacteria bacterium]
MVHKLAQSGRAFAKRLLALQTLLAVTGTAGFLLIDFKAGYSAFIGGIICVVPNLVFVIYAHRYGGARAAKHIVNSFYKGEALKLMLTAILFAGTFIFVPVSIGPLMTTYVVCLLAYWVSPFVGSK